MTQTNEAAEDIFRDRRAPANNANIAPEKCRRRRNDNTHWWLKINYVNQHLQSAGSRPRDER